MSVHYKFKSALDYDTVTFDGLHISVGDLKAAISQQKRIGKTSDFDLQITNAQTKEVYSDDNTLIPKNTSLLVARVPLAQQPKKQWEGKDQAAVIKDVAPNKGLADLSRMEGSEQDKINAMISQSTFDYDPSNYQKIRGQNQRGVVPTNYVCFKCQKRGHWIKDCPSQNSTEVVDVKRSTGIPRSFMVPVDGPKAPGAMMTPSGTFAVPAVDREAYIASESSTGEEPASGAPAAPEPTIPDELVCSLCRDLLTDAVMIPCCGNSFCDECIRGALLESEDHECPDCREKEIAPTTLIPNRFLRNSVSAFRNQTGYNRRMPHRPSNPPAQVRPAVMEPPPQGPPNGPTHPRGTDPGVPGIGRGYESDGSADDNIIVMVPPAHTHQPPAAHAPPGPHPHAPPGPHPHAPLGPHGPHGPHGRSHRPHRPRYGPPPGLKPAGFEANATVPRIDEQRASTPTIDERRDPLAAQAPFVRPPHQFRPGPPGQPFNNPAFPRHRPTGGPRPPFSDRFPLEPFQPPPPGIKDSPTNGVGEDPLEAFNRMIREKEMRARRREEERRRAASGSRSPRSPRSRSPRSPPPPRPRSPRSPPPRSPRVRPRSRSPSRPRYSRSRSPSRGRARRSPPWSPRRRRSRERSLSLTRSPSPRRRHRSPPRYRSPMRPGGPRTPLRSPLRSPLRTPLRSPLRSPPRSPPRSPHRAGRSPPRPISPHRYPGVYDELLSPPRRSVEPPYGASSRQQHDTGKNPQRYGPRNNGPPPGYAPMGKPIPAMGGVPVQNEPPPGYRGRYDGPGHGPPFEDIPPGVEPPVPGFEPSPFEKPPFGPPGHMDRERIPPPNFRDPYRAPFVEGPGPGYRDMPVPPVQNEIPVLVGEPPRFRDNYRPGHAYREPGAPPFRDGPPFRDSGPQPQYRDGPPGPPREFRGPPGSYRDSSYRGHPYRESGFRDNPPHNFREGGAPFRPPSADPREPIPPTFDPNYRDGYRDENPREHGRSSRYPPSRNRGVPRRNAPVEHERHRDVRERERFENREPSDRERVRDDKRGVYEKGRDPREERSRDYDRGREYEKEKERDYDRSTPDKKLRASPKRSRDVREKKRSESRGRSKDRDRESRRDKKEERLRDKSTDKNKEKKEKPKDRKKKKREKERDTEKKKKRDKKEKKDKDTVKKEDDDTEKRELKDDEKLLDANETEPEIEQQVTVKIEKPEPEIKLEELEPIENNLPIPAEVKEEAQPPPNDLYDDEESEAVDKEIMQNYVKTEEPETNVPETEDIAGLKDEPFDGIELQANADELDLKAEIERAAPSKEMLALLPELSKWEVDEDNAERTKEPGELTSPDEEEDGGKVTSEVLKRAENAIFAKAISSLRPIEIKKLNSDRAKLYSDEQQPKSSIQITVPVIESESRSLEVNESKKRYSKTPPPRLSVKERLGGKVDDVRRPRDARVVHSTVERVKSRSKTPKKEQPYRRVTVEKERGRNPDIINRLEVLSKGDRRIVSEAVKPDKNRDRIERKDTKKKGHDKKYKEDKSKAGESDILGHEKSATNKIHSNRERKKSVLDEAHFEPDYDETVESDNEPKDDPKKRERSTSPSGGLSEAKKVKVENETIKLDLANVKKKPDSESESSSSLDSSSSSSSDARKRKKRKKKRSKKKKKRAASDSESDSGSSSDEHKKKKKKHKHKKKSSKKKKKSKHK